MTGPPATIAIEDLPGGFARIEREDAITILDGLAVNQTASFKEEWTHLEGYYLREGLALKTIAAMKEKRSMH